MTAGFRGGGSQVAINFSGRVKAALPEKLIATWEPPPERWRQKTYKVEKKGDLLTHTLHSFIF
ncbi:MAG: hypothetical protein A3G30_02225 [Chlamydiae bacterium RIFCSPLOWO2_12_FULL_49_12]|nr:MAG: hypothetical protein A3E26_01625 [Chlamydiae bacterium RIFCSPHIGHO2_12_FULL_49_32]OGN74876.1 MAG: hypothetical protein A3G30_02225 [Chlamydiae bacterium RIFCSPLOWO2_12_FULL_49_12]